MRFIKEESCFLHIVLLSLALNMSYIKVDTIFSVSILELIDLFLVLLKNNTELYKCFPI